MPSVDLQALSAVDPKINDQDLPPESFRIPANNVLHWFMPNKVLDREPSTIGNANPKSTRSSSRPKSHSQRLNPASPIKPPNGPIPGIANSGFNFSCNRPPNLRIVPVNFSVKKKPTDPGSPKVSCFGSVLAEKEGAVKGVGCWGNFAVILGFAGVFPAVSGDVGGGGSRCKYFSGEEEWKRKEANGPELGGMKRFSCRRRSVDDVDAADCEHVAALQPLDRECPLRQS